MVEQAYLIDSHCHLHDQEFFAPEVQLALLEKAVKNQVQKIICIGTDHQDSLHAAKFTEQHPEFQIKDIIPSGNGTFVTFSLQKREKKKELISSN